MANNNAEYVSGKSKNGKCSFILLKNKVGEEIVKTGVSNTLRN